MPAKSVGLHSVSAVPAELRELSNAERSVALYVSDMPDRYRYRPGDGSVLESWIVQGAARLGLESLYRMAALFSGYRVAWVEGYLNPELERGHAERFPKAVRLDKAGRLAALITLDADMSPAALARGTRPAFDGGCPACEGSGQVWAEWIEPGCDWYDSGYLPCSLCNARELPAGRLAVAA
ncbi:hypothetical protein ACFXOK_02105 [Streptomyces sp. NPDC059173]|uniref:hypothetical protein n=1 Tax=Streptomyces sp. NPDC059173 TaxID=3346756 RepID=UPI00368DD5C3